MPVKLPLALCASQILEINLRELGVNLRRTAVHSSLNTRLGQWGR